MNGVSGAPTQFQRQKRRNVEKSEQKGNDAMSSGGISLSPFIRVLHCGYKFSFDFLSSSFYVKLTKLQIILDSKKSSLIYR